MTTCKGTPTDRQLLERFATRRDEEAFAELVHRHGPMVLGVCRHILRQEQDAEDAFQATFLVLSRKAGSIRSAEALPNWLYGVANRLATRMKAAASRRQRREVALVEPPLFEPEPGGEVGDVGPVLFAEIGRLPDKYRIPLVLCYLEGKTNEQAAQHLRCPPGTVFSRLARARERLRLRLTRRGLALSTGVLVASLVRLSEQASAAVPQSLEATTVQGALRFGAGTFGGTSNISARVVSLARWGVRSLAWRKLLVGGGVLALATLVGALSVLFLALRPGAQSLQDRLQGTWAITSMNMGGIPISGSEAQITITGNQMTLLDVPGTYRIDARKNPMQIDWIVQGGVTQGVFEFRGDQLTLCFVQDRAGPQASAAPRPADFSPQPGKMVMILNRLRR
jgi:RNA polymerase sigma factor (sigma-70 family)